jgi:predicted alpha/beta hydrolase family esterase
MQEPWHPAYEKFRLEFEKCQVTENTILIGYSYGSAFLVRWLGETKQKIRKLIMVAPWKKSKENDRYRDEFYGYSIDPGIKERVKETVMFTADHEYEDGKESLMIFHKHLGGKIIELKGRGHYTKDDMGTEEFPELLEEILNITS